MITDWLEHLREIRESEWERVTLPGMLGGFATVLLVVLLYLASADGWIPLLDSLNLVFHEAGHPLFSPFGETLHILGGTFMQLIVPALVAATMRGLAWLGILGCCLWLIWRSYRDLASDSTSIRD